MLAAYFDNYLNDEEKTEILLKPKFEAFFNRFDKDEDLLINFSDFIQTIQPFNSNI